MLRVKEICKEKGIMLTDLAKRLGMSPSGLSMALSRNVTIEVLKKMADALEVNISELFEKKEDIELYVKYQGEIYPLSNKEIIEIISRKL